MGSGCNKIDSSVNDFAVGGMVLVCAADPPVFWQSEATRRVLAPAKQWLSAALWPFSVS